MHFYHFSTSFGKREAGQKSEICPRERDTMSRTEGTGKVQGKGMMAYESFAEHQNPWESLILVWFGCFLQTPFCLIKQL